MANRAALLTCFSRTRTPTPAEVCILNKLTIVSNSNILIRQAPVQWYRRPYLVLLRSRLCFLDRHRRYHLQQDSTPSSRLHAGSSRSRNGPSFQHAEATSGVPLQLHQATEPGCTSHLSWREGHFACPRCNTLLKSKERPYNLTHHLPPC